MISKTCEHCGHVFNAPNKRSRFCGDECRKLATKEENRVRKEEQRRRQAALLMSRRAPTVSIEGVLDWIRDHHEKTGELLSYGRALGRMRAEGYDV